MGTIFALVFMRALGRLSAVSGAKKEVLVRPSFLV